MNRLVPQGNDYLTSFYETFPSSFENQATCLEHEIYNAPFKNSYSDMAENVLKNDYIKMVIAQLNQCIANGTQSIELSTPIYGKAFYATSPAVGKITIGNIRKVNGRILARSCVSWDTTQGISARARAIMLFNHFHILKKAYNA